MKKPVILFLLSLLFLSAGCSKDDGTVDNILVGTGWFSERDGFEDAVFFNVAGECLMRTRQIGTSYEHESRYPYFVDGNTVTIRASKNGQVLHSGTFTGTQMTLVGRTSGKTVVYNRGAL